MVREFYDLVYVENVGEWGEILGYKRIVTAGEWVDVTGEKAAARKNAKKARKEGLLPVFVARNIKMAKEGSWVEGAVMDVRTGIDMQVVNVMAEKGVAAMITLDYLRAGGKALWNAATAVRLLHKGRVPVLLSSGARGVEHMRAPGEIAAVGRTLGMSTPMALSAVSDNWRMVL